MIITLTQSSPLTDFLAVTDEDLYQYCQNAPQLAMSRLRRLSASLMAKLKVTKQEYLNQQHAYELCNSHPLRIPKPHRFLDGDHDDYGCLIMEYINGTPLADGHNDPLACKPGERDEMFGNLAAYDMDEVAKALKLLGERTLGHVDRPGPVSGGRPLAFPWSALGDTLEQELTSMADLERCANRRLVLSRLRDRKITFEHEPLVLVHGDICPRNIMIDEQDRIVLLDWETAAYYPAVFEAAATHYWRFQSPAKHEPFFDALLEHLKGSVTNPDKFDSDIMKLNAVQTISTIYSYSSDDTDSEAGQD